MEYVRKANCPQSGFSKLALGKMRRQCVQLPGTFPKLPGTSHRASRFESPWAAVEKDPTSEKTEREMPGRLNSANFPARIYAAESNG